MEPDESVSADPLRARPVVPVVSVVLCVRNGAAVVGRQLGALAAQDLDAPWELVVVDNGSRDATAAVVARWVDGHPTWRLVAEPTRGVNRARNRGVAVAIAPCVALCDADDEVDPGWLGAMTEGLTHHDIVGGALVDDPGARPRSAWSNVHQRDALPIVHGRPYVMGASLGFRREVFDTVGGFDRRYEGGADDVDFVLRAVDAGATVAFVPEARTRYRVKETAAAVMRQQYFYGRGYQRLLELHDLPGDRTRDTRRLRATAVTRGYRRAVVRIVRVTRRDERYGYLAGLAHLSGEAVELVAAVRASGRCPRRCRVPASGCGTVPR